MSKLLLRFRRSRRGAVAMIFALSLIPLMMLVGLSIDYSFYAQARAQFSLAGDASATYAIREANATYALDSQANESNAVAQAAAISAGEAAGATWFNSQIATLPTAYSSATTPNVVVTANDTAANEAAGFTAQVSYTGVYPPFFDLLFKSSKKWYVNGTSSATSTYSYAEILVLMDTSGSMLIGANPSDITAIDNATVCIPNSEISGTPFGDFGISGNYYGNDSRDAVNFSSGNVSGYNTTTGNCSSSHYANGSTPLDPCAFACHSATGTWTDGINRYYKDNYGVARSLNPHQTTSANGGVTLRIDAVFSAVEQIITSMQTSEQVAGQFTVGVYQFNDNVSKIVAGGGSDALPEATSNLAGALSAVEADDWMQTPTETTVPILADPSGAEDHDFTNFPEAVSHLTSGNLATGTQSALTAAGSGGTSTTPQKFIVIVTDGLEDSSSNTSLSPAGRLMGEMTGVYAEQNDVNITGGTANAICAPLKNLGFTVYVLYIVYYPVPVETYYYTGYDNTETPYVDQDFPTLTLANSGNLEAWIEGDNTNNTTSPQAPVSLTYSPDEQAMAACASGSGGPGSTSKQQYFFPATNASDITTAMTNILKSALSSTTRITD